MWTRRLKRKRSSGNFLLLWPFLHCHFASLSFQDSSGFSFHSTSSFLYHASSFTAFPLPVLLILQSAQFILFPVLVWVIQEPYCCSFPPPLTFLLKLIQKQTCFLTFSHSAYFLPSQPLASGIAGGGKSRAVRQVFSPMVLHSGIWEATSDIWQEIVAGICSASWEK